MRDPPDPRRPLVAFLACAPLSRPAGRSSRSRTRRSFQAKLAQIEKNGQPAAEAARRRARTTQVIDVEVNAYLKFLAGTAGAGRDRRSACCTPPATAASPAARPSISTRSARRRSARWTDPLGYLTGRLPVTAAGTLTTQNGVGRFQLESAQISGVTIPKSLLQELLSYYSKTAGRPAGINMDEPFQLPAAIREIRIGQGDRDDCPVIRSQGIASVPERRRTAARRRSAARRPPHGRGSPLPLSRRATRTAGTSRPSRR